jgi:hypothetical protein
LDYGTDGGTIETWGTVDDIEVYNNFALHCCGFSEFGAPTGQSDTVTDFRVYNNIIVQCAWLAHINTVDGTYGVDVQSLSFEHNTVCSPSAYALIFSTTTEPAGDALIVQNNIFSGFQNLSYNGEGFTHEYNLYSGSGPVSLGTGEIELTDPLLVASSLVDMTFDVGYGWTVDADHKARDQGADSISAAKFAIGAGYALNGTAYGIRVTVDGTSQYIASKTVKMPSDVIETWSEFWIDPNTIAMNAGDEMVPVADWRDGSGGGPWHSWQVQVDAWASPYRLVVYAYKDNGDAITATATLTDAPHRIRVHITRASSAVAADGTATWYLDNMVTPISSMTGIDNYDILPQLAAYQFGMLYSGTFTAAGGTYYIDGYRTSFCTSGLGTNLVTDAKPISGSPALAAGIASDILVDYTGVARADPPTIGAYETV